MTNATDAPFIQRCYSCGRESPAGPLLHYPGCEVGTGTGARLDAVGVGNGCKVTIETLPTPAGDAARYRWLRHKLTCGHMSLNEEIAIIGAKSGDELDAAIDAAMGSANGQG